MNDKADRPLPILSSEGLGPLPPKRVLDRHLPTGIALYGYGADDMRDYAAAAVAAERERCATIVDVPPDTEAWEVIGGGEGLTMLRELAAKIRGR
jgi:hypothetical protein